MINHLESLSAIRVVVENVRPDVDAGRFAVKRIVGEHLTVTADVFADGHDLLAAEVVFRGPTDLEWSSAPLELINNDAWIGGFDLPAIGEYRYFVRGWIDPFATWREQLDKRVDAGQDVTAEAVIGSALILAASERASTPDRTVLADFARRLAEASLDRIPDVAFDPELSRLMSRWPDRSLAGRSTHDVRVWADRAKARFSTWYEVFPRSTSNKADDHGTFRDLETRLPRIAEMGFDIVYLPPIHPIGKQYRKGRNNAIAAEPGEPGSPWAIGDEAGGHDAIHPQLGNFADFDRLIKTAEQHGIEIALDFAIQCSPDHPYVESHPEWFRKRPDGSIQYAENPPKKYQDIYPLNFDSPARLELWDELKRVIAFWVKRGVKVFRVDNPHTKSFAFWEWVIAEIHQRNPEVIFLSEAFTRPKVMYRLAKLGFTQSYTYFTWRNSKRELIEYLTELTNSPVSEFFRPNFWPNTPDILHAYLQEGGPSAFAVRYVLAATLCSSIGIYGPVYENAVNAPRERGSEEYLNSEKYEIRTWDWDRPALLQQFISRVNAIRKSEPALQRNDGLRFHHAESNDILFYSKQAKGAGTIVVAVNLDPHNVRGSRVRLPIEELGFDSARPYQMRDLLDDTVYLWNNTENYVELNPVVRTSHIFRIEQ